VDAASPVLEEQMAEVEKVLDEIGAATCRRSGLQQAGSAGDDQRRAARQRAVLRANGAEPTPRVFVSARDGSGLAELRQLIAEQMLASSECRAYPRLHLPAIKPALTTKPTRHEQHPTPPAPQAMTWRERLLTPVSRAAGRLLNGRNDGPRIWTSSGATSTASSPAVRRQGQWPVQPQACGRGGRPT
jgi:hypothetical protein